jgi:hypothetical protein
MAIEAQVRRWQAGQSPWVLALPALGLPFSAIEARVRRGAVRVLSEHAPAEENAQGEQVRKAGTALSPTHRRAVVLWADNQCSTQG